MKNKYITIRKSVKGFTIIEFLVASTVFTVVLVMVAAVIISFTRHFYHGVNSASTQTSARTIMNDVSNAIEFSPAYGVPIGANGSGNVQSECIGYTQFDYQIDAEQGSNNLNAIWETNNANPNICKTNQMPTASSILLLSNGMRLLNFTINPTVSTCTDQCDYTISVSVAYGNNSVLCDIQSYTSANCQQTGSDNASTTNGWSNLTSSNTACVENNASQFCDIATLSTTAGMRL